MAAATRVRPSSAMPSRASCSASDRPLFPVPRRTPTAPPPRDNSKSRFPIPPTSIRANDRLKWMGSGGLSARRSLSCHSEAAQNGEESPAQERDSHFGGGSFAVFAAQDDTLGFSATRFPSPTESP